MAEPVRVTSGPRRRRPVSAVQHRDLIEAKILHKEIEEQFSERDGWWLYSLKETPLPGTYDLRDFIQEANLNPVQRTYAFKGEGRKKSPELSRREDYLLPGCYNAIESIQCLEKKPSTYSFKNTPRGALLLGVRDKDVNVAPCQYDLMTPPVPTLSSKHFMFRSAVQRFPTIYFTPKPGPGPGHYEVKKTDQRHGISSCFQSKVPRFKQIHSNVQAVARYLNRKYVGNRDNSNTYPSNAFWKNPKII